MICLVRLQLSQGESGTVTASYTVPCSANIGDVSNTIMTATSTDGTKNSAVSVLVVVTEVKCTLYIHLILLFAMEL